ncbi:MAG: zinc metalloprotease [Solirubrobacteraceae bacterium]
MSPARPPKHRQCGAQQVNERLYELDPALRGRHQRIEDECRRSIEKGEAQRVWRKLVTIQVVVHVVAKTDEENISDEQIGSQIDVLNQDYRATNADHSKIPDAWTSLAADPNIRFALATKDPKGKPTNGITRVQTTRDSFGTGDSVKKKSGGGTPPWATDRYLNIWVCNLGDGLLGYAQFPGGPAKTDGVVILYTAFGTKGAAADPFNLGRTATHEIGHFLNLRHIWGDTNDCSGSDQVSDTPRAQAPNYGRPDFPHISCNNGPNGDMFMDYMDYVDDAAMFMFTQGQAARMNATLAGPRKKLAAAGS